MKPRFAPASEISVRSNPDSELWEGATETAQPAASAANVPLIPLQELIQEFLMPLALGKRTTNEWRSLYRSFFAFFAPGGEACPAEQKAWQTAFEAFNRNLVAVQNRVVRVVPMTFQDCLDAIDSFKQDGLIENRQRDIVWQPKKILLLMAAMIGRILAGWQADQLAISGARQDLSPLQRHLIDENRKASYLAYVFSFDPRFPIHDYHTAGLEPVLRSFPHCADALVENGVFRCQPHTSSYPGDPLFVELGFRRPLREPLSSQSLNTLRLVLRSELGSRSASGTAFDVKSSELEYSEALLAPFAFEAQEPPEAKWPRMESLFEYALAGRWLVCSSQRATASTAATLARTLGRTRAEQSAIEQFFALGFQTGAGNEPWLENARRDGHEPKPDTLRKAREEFGRWKSTFLFFEKAGQPEAAGLPGARLRQELLQPKGASLFNALRDTLVYHPLMAVAMMVDGEGKWLLVDRDLCAFARSLHAGLGKTLLEAATVVRTCAGSLPNHERKAVFLFECALGILRSVCREHNRRTPDSIGRMLGALREKYETLFQVSLEEAPSLKASPQDALAQRAEARRRLEATEQRILTLVGEPLEKKVSAPLRETLALWSQESRDLVRFQMPGIRLQDQAAFVQSVTQLCAWIAQMSPPSAERATPSSNPALAALAASRRLAEEGRAVEALEEAVVVHPTLSKTKRQALVPFFTGLSWLLLGDIEREHEEGHTEAANALAEKARVLIAEPPALDEFNSLVQELVLAKMPPGSVAGTTSVPDQTLGLEPANPCRQQAQGLLTVYADELSSRENRLEREFLCAVIEGSEASFQRREKLRNRLRKLTQWGGREPYKTTLRLLDSVPAQSG